MSTSATSPASRKGGSGTSRYGSPRCQSAVRNTALPRQCALGLAPVGTSRPQCRSALTSQPPAPYKGYSLIIEELAFTHFETVLSADEASDVLIGADPGLDVIPGPVKTRRREPTEKSVDSADENAHAGRRG